MKNRWFLLPFLLESLLCAMALVDAYPWHRERIFCDQILALLFVGFATTAWTRRSMARRQMLLLVSALLLLGSILMHAWTICTTTGSILQAGGLSALHILLGLLALWFCHRAIAG